MNELLSREAGFSTVRTTSSVTFEETPESIDECRSFWPFGAQNGCCSLADGETGMPYSCFLDPEKSPWKAPHGFWLCWEAGLAKAPLPAALELKALENASAWKNKRV